LIRFPPSNTPVKLVATVAAKLKLSRVYRRCELVVKDSKMVAWMVRGGREAVRQIFLSINKDEIRVKNRNIVEKDKSI